MNSAYIPSVDGYFVPPNHHRRVKKRVPRNIAVKPKHRPQPQRREVIEEEEVDVDEIPELKRSGSKGSAGKAKSKVSKFFKKMSKVRVGFMYEV